MRKDSARLVMTTARGQRSSASTRLPEWSLSLWETKIQRSSSGSTRENRSSKNSARFVTMPVSTRIGSAARISMELREVAPAPAAVAARITKVPCATSCGVWRREAGAGTAPPSLIGRLPWTSPRPPRRPASHRPP